MTREELKSRRIALGLTQAQMAAKVGRCGITYARYEQGLIGLPAWLEAKVAELEKGKKGQAK